MSLREGYPSTTFATVQYSFSLAYISLCGNQEHMHLLFGSKTQVTIFCEPDGIKNDDVSVEDSCINT